MTEQPITLKDISTFFGYGALAAFAKDWKALDDKSKDQIKGGIKDGTFDYTV